MLVITNAKDFLPDAIERGHAEERVLGRVLHTEMGNDSRSLLRKSLSRSPTPGCLQSTFEGSFFHECADGPGFQELERGGEVSWPTHGALSLKRALPQLSEGALLKLRDFSRIRIFTEKSGCY